MILCRRMIYLKTILDQNNDEVVKKVYKAIKQKPMKTDRHQLQVSDFEKMNIKLNENQIENTNALTYKKNINTTVWNAFSKELQEKQQRHIKVKHNAYDNKRIPQT